VCAFENQRIETEKRKKCPEAFLFERFLESFFPLHLASLQYEVAFSPFRTSSSAGKRK